MSEWASLFGSEFMPHGHCYLWRPDILWLNVGSDALIALAYFSIPLALTSLVRRRRDLSFGWLFWMFAAFIFLCGSTHLVSIWTVWHGAYGIEGMVKLATAGVSVATAALLWPVLPKALALPSPTQLSEANAELRREIQERRRVEQELLHVQGRLESRVRERTADLEQANLALTREVADRERAEEHFRRALESLPNGMLMVDASGVITLANDAAETIFGYAKQELIGQPIERLIPERFRAAHPIQRAGFLAEPAARAMGAGRDLFGRRADGTEVPVEIGLNPIQTDEGWFVLSSVVDITERKRAEWMLQAKNQELQRSLQELDEYAHVVSHDLKAPLRGIISLSTWISEDCAELLPPRAQEQLDMIAERTRRMGDLIDGILRYSRVGRARTAPEAIDAGELVRDVIDSLAAPEEIRVRMDAGLPTVSFDRTQLRQVFQNLLSNAIQHLGRPGGEVVVSCRVEPQAFEFSVRDDGVGIEERHHARIFRIFQSLEPDRHTTGIGLALVKKIVEAHGGAIWVESQPGAGATFRFTVPRTPGWVPAQGVPRPDRE
jgi:PAS domain S-box-containing protein